MSTSIVDRLQDHAEKARELNQTMVGSWPVDLHDDLIEASREIDRLRRQQTLDAVKVNRQLDELREQLQMARTEAKDVSEFREREKKEYQNIIYGVRIAIDQMMIGLKGGKF